MISALTVAAEVRKKFRRAETVMAYLDGMTQLALRPRLQPCTMFESLVMVAGASGCRIRRSWKEREECFEAIGMESQVRRQLPEYRTKLVLQP